ncbi:MAG: UvrD-helicase domain-containing protein [Planctomycetota bacterium]
MSGFQPTLVRASAGTGKTYQLTARLLQILLAGASPDTILATTFTRKAAGEILDRVLISLANAAVGPESEQALNDLRQQVDREHLTSKTCAELLHRVLQQIHRVRIGTLDSLFSQLARSLPFELSLPPGWRLTDDIEEQWLRRTAVSNLIDSLEISQTETLIAMLGRGDHKRSVARELVDLVDHVFSAARGADPDVWDTLDVPTMPDSKMLTAMAGQLRMLDVPQKSLRAQATMAADHMDARDFAPLVDQTLIRNIEKARRTGDPVKYGRSKFPETIDDAMDVLYAAVMTVSRSLLRSQNHATASVVTLYAQCIEAIKQSQAAFGFDDIAVKLGDVFSEASAESLSKRLDSRVDHLLLDEFQDTSPAQWMVLKTLAEWVTSDETDLPGESDFAAGGGRSFFCVGDTTQAIYGWRGGVAEIFDAVGKSIPDLNTKSQNVSYRSSDIVLDAVNEAFGNLHRHPLAIADDDHPADRGGYEARSLSEFERQFPLHTAAKAIPGYVALKTCGLTNGEDGQNERPGVDEITGALHAATCQTVSCWNASAPDLSIGVLTRTNAFASDLVGQLQALGIDVSGEGGNPLTDSVAVRWVLSALKMIEHPGDGRHHFHVQNSPLKRVLESLGEPLENKIERDGLPDTLLTLGLPLARVCDDAESARLKQLIELTGTHAALGRTRLRDFIDMVERKRIPRPRAASVRVMTIHQSKGLEFDAVVLPEIHKPLLGPPPQVIADVSDVSQPAIGLCRGESHHRWHLLPQRWQRAMGRSVTTRMTEALCLMYVAMTRAKQGLSLIIPPATNAEFDQKSPASLLYHAWGCQADPTEPDCVLFQRGDPSWLHHSKPK